ncbi:MAG: DUF814 domain-containing protein, partial [Desulfovibrionaceae bacterium]|nr:DUF814 domain-containing protein [Desulfovibrionaceae bacterium]
MEKIQAIGQDLILFLFFTSQGKLQLCLKSGRQGSFLFFTKHPLQAGQAPPAEIMRLRKYFNNHRVASVVTQPFARKIWLLFEGGATEQGKLPWLLLDLKEGVSLIFKELEDTPKTEQFSFPPLDNLKASLEAWREWPVLTPKLRRTLEQLDPLDAKALLSDLEEGGGEVFAYYEQDSSKISQVSAWPLPSKLRANLREESSFDVLDLLERAGQNLVFAFVLHQKEREACQALMAQQKKLNRLAKKLNEEEQRLLEMCQAQDQAIIIQQNLWHLNKHSKTDCLEIENPTHPQVSQIIRLDPRYTILENMQRLFHTAERGKRGLQFLAQRKADLNAKQAQLAQGISLYKNQAPTQATNIEPVSGVQEFRSSDGVLLLRGKNARGNLACRKLAQGHDLWLHASGGPGSHVIIKLNFPGQNVPKQTLIEAGQLAANKSWVKDAPDAEIIYAEIRHIKPMRGA